MKPLLLLCALLFATHARADEDIQPFGGLDWNDDILTVITKVNKIDGMKHVELQLGRYDVDLSGVTSRDVAASKLDALLRKAMVGTNPVARAREYNENFDKYQTKDGKTLRCMREAIISGESVLVAGVLYDFSATMGAHPGLQLTNPKNIFVVKGTEVAEPLVLEGVSLRPAKSNTGSTDAVREALDKKYHFPYAQTAKGSKTGSVRFNSGSVYYSRSAESEHAIDDAYHGMLGGAATEGKSDTSDKF